MALNIDTIITLENNERYVVLNKTIYGGINYFLVMGVDDKKNIIPTNVAIIKEINENQETYIERVTDQDLIIRLTKILKDAK